jgi:hypothetical protein
MVCSVKVLMLGKRITIFKEMKVLNRTHTKCRRRFSKQYNNNNNNNNNIFFNFVYYKFTSTTLHKKLYPRKLLHLAYAIIPRPGI